MCVSKVKKGNGLDMLGRTFAEEILQVLDGGLSDLLVRCIRSNERKNVVCENVGVCIRAASQANKKLAGASFGEEAAIRHRVYSHVLQLLNHPMLHVIRLILGEMHGDKIRQSPGTKWTDGEEDWRSKSCWSQGSGVTISCKSSATRRWQRWTGVMTRQNIRDIK